MATTQAFEFNFDSNCTITPLNSVPKPVISLQAFGASGSTIYSYRVSAVSDYGETLASDPVVITGNATLSSNNFIRISWTSSSYATSYKVYGRTVNSEQLIATVNNNYYDDIGTGSPSGSLPVKDTTGYDPSKLNIGRFQKLFTSNTTPENNYISNQPHEMFHFFDEMRVIYNSTSAPLFYMYYANDVISYTERYDLLIFQRSEQSGTQIRKYHLVIFDRFTWTFTHKGFINITFTPVGQAASDYDLIASMDKTTDGLVNLSTSTAEVTGINTTFFDKKISVGARIGFGSTDPEKITTWYYVNRINSNTSITIDRLPSANQTNVPYIIEEIRLIILPAPQYGINYVKGLNIDDFKINGSVTIPFANRTDGQKATYNLKESFVPTSTNTFFGMCVTPQKDNNTQYLYVKQVDNSNVNNRTRILRYNIRKDLLLDAGTDYSCYDFTTGQLLVNSWGNGYGGLFPIVMKSGPYANKPSFIYRGVDFFIRTEESYIVKNTLNLPGETFVYPVTSYGSRIVDIRNSFEIVYDDYSDFFYTASNGYGFAAFKFQFGNELQGVYAMGGQFLYTPGKWNPKNTFNYPYNGYPKTYTVKNGIIYTFNTNISIQDAINTNIFAMPVGGDNDLPVEYENRVICPEIDTYSVSKFNKLLVNYAEEVASEDFPIQPDPFRVFYRTTGIKDNSGVWTRLIFPYDLSAVRAQDSIQFMFNFKIFGLSMCPARIHSYTLLAEKEELLPKYFKFNSNITNLSQNIYGFEQSKVYSNNLTLKISYIRKKDNKLVFSQTSSETTFGNFQYLAQGNVWTNGIGTNTVGTLRRFVLTANILMSEEVKLKIEIV
jgi:hypothetical protein